MSNMTQEDDAINTIIKKFECHPSILKIKEKFSNENIFLFSDVSLGDIEQELKSLNVKKSGTFKNIPSKIFKDSISECSSFLLNLVNELIEKSEFPDELKLADVTPVFKKGETTNAKNYRPVSVLPVVSKVFLHR